jgi:hypothetical protein
MLRVKLIEFSSLTIEGIAASALLEAVTTREVRYCTR